MRNFIYPVNIHKLWTFTVEKNGQQSHPHLLCEQLKNKTCFDETSQLHTGNRINCRVWVIFKGSTLVHQAAPFGSVLVLRHCSFWKHCSFWWPWQEASGDCTMRYVWRETFKVNAVSDKMRSSGGAWLWLGDSGKETFFLPPLPSIGPFVTCTDSTCVPQHRLQPYFSLLIQLRPIPGQLYVFLLIGCLSLSIFSNLFVS